jgi:hypothetical protein
LGLAQTQRREARTNALWEGYRRIYFGELEAEPSHKQVMERLRTEVGDLQRRAERARLSVREGEAPFPPVLPRRDDDDEPPPPSTNVLISSLAPTMGTRGADPRHSDRGNSGSSTNTSVPDDGQTDAAKECEEITATVPEMDSTSMNPDFPVTRPLSGMVRKLVLLSKRVLRRVLAAKESLFKFGTFVPKNDRQADSSPEASRWKAGRMGLGMASSRAPGHF